MKLGIDKLKPSKKPSIRIKDTRWASDVLKTHNIEMLKNVTNAQRIRFRRAVAIKEDEKTAIYAEVTLPAAHLPTLAHCHCRCAAPDSLIENNHTYLCGRHHFFNLIVNPLINNEKTEEMQNEKEEQN